MRINRRQRFLENSDAGAVRGRHLCSMLVLLVLCWAASMAAIGAANEADNTITLNLKNADIREVASTVGEITHKNFIVDPRVQGRVTVLSSEPISSDAVYKAFLSVLQVHGLAAVPTADGKFMKIVPALNARQLPGPTTTKNEPGDIVVTEVINVQNVPAAQLVSVLRPLVSTESHLVAYPPSNMLIISDRAANVERIKKIVHRVDKPATSQFEVIPLENAAASDVVNVLTDFLQKQNSQTASVNPLQLAADERTNSILVSGDKHDRMRIRALVAHLDTPAGQGGNTQVIYLRYAKAKDLADILKGYSEEAQQSGNKGSHGGGGAAPGNQHQVSVLADERTNSLIVTAPSKSMRQIRDIIARLDVRRAQVLVQGIIAELNSDRSAELGITWAVDALNQAGSAGITNFSGTGAGIAQIGGAVAGATGLGGGTTTTGGSGAVGGVASALNAIPDGLTLGVGSIVKAGISFAALIRALSADSTTNILSTPSITTLDNQEADIKVAQKVPFVTGQFTNTGTSNVTNGTVNPFQTVQREDVGIELKITPQINEGNSVLLKIDQTVSSLTGSSISGQPVTNDREIKTNVIANDGEVIVLGGLIDNNLQESEQRVPVLGSIPLFGNLFKYRKTDKTKRNLLIFLQPAILRTGKNTSYFTNRKYKSLRDLELKNNSRVQLRPGLKRPTIPPLNQLRKRGLKPEPGTKRTGQGGHNHPASGGTPPQEKSSHGSSH